MSDEEHIGEKFSKGLTWRERKSYGKRDHTDEKMGQDKGSERRGLDIGVAQSVRN